MNNLLGPGPDEPVWWMTRCFFFSTWWAAFSPRGMKVLFRFHQLINPSVHYWWKDGTHLINDGGCCVLSPLLMKWRHVHHVGRRLLNTGCIYWLEVKGERSGPLLTITHSEDNPQSHTLTDLISKPTLLSSIQWTSLCLQPNSCDRTIKAPNLSSGWVTAVRCLHV